MASFFTIFRKMIFNCILMKLKLLLLLLFYSCFGQIPAYYSSIDFSQSGENLKNQLATLITATHTTELVYTSGSSGLLDTWTTLKQSDLDVSNLNNVLLIYGWNDQSTTVSEHRSRSVDESCHTSSCTSKWVREHVFPRSMGTPNLGSEGAGADANNLRAIDAQRNNTRGNRLFGAANPNIPSYAISANSWYPGDEWIGDVARIIMYMYLRYPTQCAAINVATGDSTFAPFGDMPDILLQWNAQDPVSQYEINRNNILNTLQGNRNPFIDNPYLATIIWNGPPAENTWIELTTNQEDLNSISLYPIPTKGMLYISNHKDLNYNYKVYSAIGQLVKENTTTQSIDVSNNPPGLYFVTLQLENKAKTFKIIIN